MIIPSRGRHWDPNPNPKFLGVGLGSIFQNFGIGTGIDFSKFWDWDWDRFFKILGWDWAWDCKFRTKSQEISTIKTPGYPETRACSENHEITKNPESRGLEKLSRSNNLENFFHVFRINFPQKGVWNLTYITFAIF